MSWDWIELAERTHVVAVVAGMPGLTLRQPVDMSGNQQFLTRRQAQHKGDGRPFEVGVVDEGVDQPPRALVAGFTHPCVPSTVDQASVLASHLGYSFPRPNRLARIGPHSNDDETSL